MKTLFLTTVSLALLLQVHCEQPFCSNTCHGVGVVHTRNCHCDAACDSVFDDCCADADHSEMNRRNNRRSDLICESMPNGAGNAYTVTDCLRNWQGPDSVRNSCIHPPSLSGDPVGSIRVTNYDTGTTYSNYNCAICNNDAETLMFWHIHVSCSFRPNVFVDKDEAVKYIFYSEPDRQWGYLLRDHTSGESSFYACNVTFQAPLSLAKKIRRCHPEEVRSCAATWKSDFIRQMCDGYLDPVFSNETRYRNFYCAICNHVDQSQLTCGGGIGPRYGGTVPTEGGRDRTSFAMLLDVNLSDGNNVGRRTVSGNCASGEVFDPFARRCRNVVCGLPGFVMRDGRCSRQ